MPIHKVSGGYKWGGHGHVYPSNSGAAKQAAAAYAHGYKGKSMDVLEGNLHSQPDINSLLGRLDSIITKMSKASAFAIATDRAQKMGYTDFSRGSPGRDKRDEIAESVKRSHGIKKEEDRRVGSYGYSSSDMENSREMNQPKQKPLLSRRESEAEYNKNKYAQNSSLNARHSIIDPEVKRRLDYKSLVKSIDRFVKNWTGADDDADAAMKNLDKKYGSYDEFLKVHPENRYERPSVEAFNAHRKKLIDADTPIKSVVKSIDSFLSKREFGNDVSGGKIGPFRNPEPDDPEEELSDELTDNGKYSPEEVREGLKDAALYAKYDRY